MAQITVVEDLVDVQFYTALDPYYYIVDNRPLVDLDNNIRLVAAASDASAGSADRAALSGATAAYATLGYGQTVAGDPVFQSQGMFSSNYELSGFEIRFTHGYLVHPVDQGGSPAYVEPKVAIHDAITPIVVQVGRGGTVQARFRASTASDRVPSADSSIEVCEVAFKQGSSQGDFPLPDAGWISIMHIDVPTGSPTLDEAHLTKTNMKTIDETSNLIGTTKISYTSYRTSLGSGLSNISLAGSDIDVTRTSAMEVFVQGINQFDWTYNAVTNQITLADPLTEAADIRVRQANLELI